MEKISSNKSTIKLTGLKDELGWGNHTIENALVTVDDKLINQYSTICCNEFAILICTTIDPDEKFNYFSKSTRKSETYLIKFENILDIQIERKSQTNIMESLSENRNFDISKELKRQKIFIYFKKQNKKTSKDNFLQSDYCILDIFESIQFPKYIISAWHSVEIRRCTRLGPIIGDANKKLAIDYYNETLDCLNTACSPIINPNREDKYKKKSWIQEYKLIAGILDEFSIEVVLDLELKDAVFHSRQLIMLCLELISSLLTKHSENTLILSTNIDNTIDTNHDSSVPHFSSSSIHLKHLDEDTQLNVMTKILNRMKLINKVFKLLSCIMFCTETVVNRYGVLSYPSPLDLGSWTEILTEDCYIQLFELMNISTESEELLNEMKFHDVIKSNDELCNPTSIKNKSLISNNIIAFDFEKNPIFVEIVQVRNSIKYFKTIIQVELVRMCNLGIPRSVSSFSTISKTLVLQSYAECFTKQLKWEIEIENYLCRLLYFLDDFLSKSQISEQGMKQHAYDKKPPTTPLMRRFNDDDDDRIIISKNSIYNSNKKVSKFTRIDSGMEYNNMKGLDKLSSFKLNDSLNMSNSYIHVEHSLEKQEILMYYTMTLVLNLSLDSSRVRTFN
jgi:hypothetical protein